MRAIKENKTLTIEDPSSRKKSINYECVCKVKYKSDGPIERYKARLVI